MATLLLDLLTLAEETEDQRTAELRFDIGLLAERLVGATDWWRRILRRRSFVSAISPRNPESWKSLPAWRSTGWCVTCREGNKRNARRSAFRSVRDLCSHLTAEPNPATLHRDASLFVATAALVRARPG